MKNEYGINLDSNGYAPSILSHEKACFICQSNVTVRHEIFHASLRQKSKAYGLWINVCPIHHQQIHENADLDRAFKKVAQTNAMKHYGWTTEEFIQRFYKNYKEDYL